jgi:hypothetical protein
MLQVENSFTVASYPNPELPIWIFAEVFAY